MIKTTMEFTSNTTLNTDLLKADIEGLHIAAKSRSGDDFIRKLPILRRENQTLKIAEIIRHNMMRKKNLSRLNLTLPILTQSFGSGKTFLIENLPKLFETYCPENLLLKESYHIYVRLDLLELGKEDLLERLYSLIFRSFLK